MRVILKTITFALLFASLWTMTSCSNGGSNSNSGAIGGSAAEKAFVAPGELDEFYAFISGGFSGQLAVYGLPSGRLFKVIPVFSVDGEKAYGFNEETKPLLETSHGFVPGMILTTLTFPRQKGSLTADGVSLMETIPLVSPVSV